MASTSSTATNVENSRRLRTSSDGESYFCCEILSVGPFIGRGSLVRYIAAMGHPGGGRNDLISEGQMRGSVSCFCFCALQLVWSVFGYFPYHFVVSCGTT